MPTKRKTRAAQKLPPSPPPKRPRRASTKDACKRAPPTDDEDDDGNKTNDGPTVLGDLSGDHRITGDEPSTDPETTNFQIPFDDKVIVCERRSTSTGDGDNDDSTPPALIFTHGAGGGLTNPAMATFAAGFGGVSPVVCFQGTMNLTSRTKAFHAVIEHYQQAQKDGCPAPALGGRSMGARAAVIAANERSENKETRLVLVSYPLVARNRKTGKEDVRDEILRQIQKDVDVLFVVGERDEMCELARLNEVREGMGATSWVVEVKGADHGMSLTNKNGVEAIRRETGRVAAEWLKSRDEQKRYCCLSWDGDDGKVVGGGWVEDTEGKSGRQNPNRARKGRDRE